MQKNICIAYTLWLFGGWFGLHHMYLRRDHHAVVCFTTFGICWLMDLFSIPRYVREANDIDKTISILKNSNIKPPSFSIEYSMGMILVALFWAQTVQMAIPVSKFASIDWYFLEWCFVPMTIALGVWFVGNIDPSIEGSITHALTASYVSYCTLGYLLKYHSESAISYVSYYLITIFGWFHTSVNEDKDVTARTTGAAICATIAFQTMSKRWRKKKNNHSFCRRMFTFFLCISIYFSLWGCYFYFNGKIEDSNGDEIPVHEAINHFFTSPWWTDLKQSVYDVWVFAQHNGWYEVWKQIIDLSDPQGEQNAYRVLGLSPGAPQSQITTQWRKLSRENHPDKIKEPERKQEAQEKFMEIQQAYEILSNIKNKRKKKNKISNDEF